MADEFKETLPGSESTRVCIYCGGADSMSVDHVPPQNLFPPPRPSTLITVPSCQGCNRGFSKDDEYFRAVMTSRMDVGDNPAVLSLLETVYRGLARPQAAGFRNSFVAAASPVEVSTRAGIYLGRALSFNVEYPRLESTVARIVRGLYYHEHGKRLPSDCDISVFLDVGFVESYAAGDRTVEQLVGQISSGTQRMISEDVFRYAFRDVDPTRNASGWFLVFYKRIWFMVITHDPNLTAGPVKS